MRGSGSVSSEGPLSLAVNCSPSLSWPWKLGLHAGERLGGVPKGLPPAEEPTDSASASASPRYGSPGIQWGRSATRWIVL